MWMTAWCRSKLARLEWSCLAPVVNTPVVSALSAAAFLSSSLTVGLFKLFYSFITSDIVKPAWRMIWAAPVKAYWYPSLTNITIENKIDPAIAMSIMLRQLHSIIRLSSSNARVGRQIWIILRTNPREAKPMPIFLDSGSCCTIYAPASTHKPAENPATKLHRSQKMESRTTNSTDWPMVPARL